MSRRKTRVLFIGESATLSHTVRPVVLSRMLPKDEFEVFLACDGRFSALFPEDSEDWLHVYSSDPEQTLERARRAQPLFDETALERYVEDDLRLIHDIKPDIVVGDLRLSLSVSCPLERLPFVNILNAQWSPNSALGVELVDNPLEDALGPDLSRLVARLAWPFGSAAYCMPLNAVRMRHGLPPLALDIKQMMCCGDYVVFPDVPELVPVNPLPRRQVYLGPVLWSPAVDLPDWWDDLPTDRPAVYVNLGSSGAGAQLGTVLAALADLPVTVIAATAGRSTLSSIPDNAYVADYLPGDRCVERADLSINNGGTMSGQQTLAGGVPMLALVTHSDQLAFAQAVRMAGAGELQSSSKATQSSIRSVVGHMIGTNSYRQAAGRIADTFAQYDPAQRFLTVMQGVTR